MMENSLRRPSEKWVKWIGIPFIGVFMSVLHAVSVEGSPIQFLFVLLLSLTSTILVWEGNFIISRFIGNHISWLDFPVKRTLLQLIMNVVFTAVAVVCINLLFNSLLYDDILPHSLNITIGAALMAMCMNMVYVGLYFSRKWRISVMRAEILKREQLRIQYLSLKHQLNPHFLFNSLNALANKMEENPADSVHYVHDLASLYRYIIQSRNTRLVPLYKEVQQVQKYLNLQKLRFGENLNSELDIPDSAMQAAIPPLALQALVESAINKNVISRECPLNINISLANEKLVITNSIHKRKDNVDDGAGINSVMQCYEAVSLLPVEVINEEKNFTIKLPMLSAV